MLIRNIIFTLRRVYVYFYIYLFMNNFLQDILALTAILSGILVITSKNPVISVLFLISVFVNVAGYLVLLRNRICRSFLSYCLCWSYCNSFSICNYNA